MKGMLVELRKATRADIGLIMGLIDEGRASLAELGIDQWQGGYPQREVIERDIDDGASYLVYDGDVAVATAMLAHRDEVNYHALDGEWLTSSTPENPCYVVIHRVAVSGERAKGGVGSFVMTSAIELARELGCESVRVDTHPGNVPMRRLVEKFGFTERGTIIIDHAEGLIPVRVAYERLV